MCFLLIKYVNSIGVIFIFRWTVHYRHLLGLKEHHAYPVFCILLMIATAEGFGDSEFSDRR